MADPILLIPGVLEHLVAAVAQTALIDLAVEQRRVVLEDDPLAIAVATDGQDRCSPHPRRHVSDVCGNSDTALATPDKSSRSGFDTTFQRLDRFEG